MGWKQDHVHVRCSDCETTVNFFEDNFGAQEEGRIESHGRLIVTLSIGDALYKFSPKKPNETIDPATRPPRFGMYHMALKTDNLTAEVARLISRGVKFTQDLEQVNPKTLSTFIEGPDEISIELLQRNGIFEE